MVVALAYQGLQDAMFMSSTAPGRAFHDVESDDFAVKQVSPLDAHHSFDSDRGPPSPPWNQQLLPAALAQLDCHCRADYPCPVIFRGRPSVDFLSSHEETKGESVSVPQAIAPAAPFPDTLTQPSTPGSSDSGASPAQYRQASVFPNDQVTGHNSAADLGLDVSFLGRSGCHRLPWSAVRSAEHAENQQPQHHYSPHEFGPCQGQHPLQHETCRESDLGVQGAQHQHPRSHGSDIAMTNVNKLDVDDWLPDLYDRMQHEYETSEHLRDTCMTGMINSPYSYFDRSTLLAPSNGFPHCHAYSHVDDNGMMDHLLNWPVSTATSTPASTSFAKPDGPAMSLPLLHGQDSLSSHLSSATAMPTTQEEQHYEMLMSQDSAAYSHVPPSADVNHASGADMHAHNLGCFPSPSGPAGTRGTGLGTGSSFGSVDGHGPVVDMQHSDQPCLRLLSASAMNGPFDSQPHSAPWLVGMQPEPTGTLSPKDLPLRGTLSPAVFDGPVPLNLLTTDDAPLLSGDQEEEMLSAKDLSLQRESSRTSSSSSSNHSSKRSGGASRTTTSRKGRKQLPPNVSSLPGQETSQPSHETAASPRLPPTTRRSSGATSKTAAKSPRKVLPSPRLLQPRRPLKASSSTTRSEKDGKTTTTRHRPEEQQQRRLAASRTRTSHISPAPSTLARPDLCSDGSGGVGPAVPMQSPATTDRIARDEFLLVSKRKGMTYREIRAAGGFTEAESTLRGRYRTLTKSREERVRKPEWSEKDIELLKKAVRKFTRGLGPEAAKVPWKQVAEYIHQKGGSYLFGNATCRKKWDELALAEKSRSVAGDGDVERGR